ncbi:hypothetical protein [Hymenobacter sp. YC55]|uniref:hypothetical protein n=1 Tax=Hymenobacter sp. YC55 TaxID=3034019 RepID=UPI0023F77BB4|nr:hypothetical protein [Hymenobacter sp. YC55]MDF7815450.1 hypothetical protein [Hymenobacter sp. YC55]
MVKTASKSCSQTDAENTADGRKSTRTFHGIVLEGGFTVRQLCSGMHLAAESLKAAYDEPGRLSLNAVMAFSELVGEEPEKLVGDLFAEIRELREKGPAPATSRRSRSLKPKPRPSEGG